MSSSKKVTPMEKHHSSESGLKKQLSTTLVKKEKTPARIQLSKILDSKLWTIVVTTATVYALLGDDVRISAFARSADDFFFTLSSISLLLFAAELGANCYVKDGYVGGFYFILDFAATISLIPDIGWIWDSVMGNTGGDGDEGSVAALKAGRASRAGTKAGRIVRIVRLVRMVRIVKLYKMSKGDHDEALEEQIRAEPSKVGKKMSEMTTRRVIVIVLCLVLFIPFFDGGLDDSLNEFQQNGLRQLHMFTQQNVSESFLQLQVENYVRNTDRLLYLSLNTYDQNKIVRWISNTKFQTLDDPTSDYTLNANPTSGWTKDLIQPSAEKVQELYRSTEYNAVSEVGCYSIASGRQVTEFRDECVSLALFDNSPETKFGAGMNVLKTFFIMVVLGFSAVAFSKIAETLVIMPIERMMDLITRLSENPLASTKRVGMENAEDKTAKEKGYETALLENTLMKIGALMQVGFGAAGADIIGKNMGSGELDSMLPGKKITAIFGFCDIRKFTDTTECLQEEVMVYVNKLADIVHSGVHDYYGMANKNVGDAFLLSWKICDGELPGFSSFDDMPNEDMRAQVNAKYKCAPNPGAGHIDREITPTEMAESALAAFIKCHIDLDNANTDGPLTCYLSNERVVKRFGPDFRIKMGFGMHVGWAIEGAIGSRFKIDATYISPHAEMADRLEAGSKIFQTPLNLSHWFVALLSPAARKNLRLIDRIEVRGVSQPCGVYTFDVETMSLTFGTPCFRDDDDDTEPGAQCPVDFEHDVQFKEIQEGLHPGFLEAFRKAVDLYLAGDFQAAREGLLTATELRPKDGPSDTLMTYLKSQNYQAPENWPGYRLLEEF